MTVNNNDQTKYVYNEMPDFTLGVLQARFNAKNLEALYKKYEQRYQLSEYPIVIY